MPKTLLDLSKRRRSVRRYIDENVSLDDILYALKVASLAPSGANEQPWRFIIVDDDDTKKRIRAACELGERHLYDNVKGECARIFAPARGMTIKAIARQLGGEGVFYA